MDERAQMMIADILKDVNMEIVNCLNTDPIFQTVNGSSWIYITLSRGIRINWLDSKRAEHS